MEKPRITLRQAQGDTERSRSITKEMPIREIIEKYPKTIPVFNDYDLHCAGCPMAQEETLEEAVQLHQIDLKKLLEDLNKAANEK